MQEIFRMFNAKDCEENKCLEVEYKTNCKYI